MNIRTTEDGCVHYLGKGDTLLMLRGFGTLVEHYLELAKLFANQFEVVILSTSQLKGRNPQPDCVDEYIKRELLICEYHGIQPKFDFGHSTGGHIVLKEPIVCEKHFALSPLVPVNYGLEGFIARAVYQGVLMSVKSNDKKKGLEVATSIAKKVLLNPVDCKKFVDSLKNYDYQFKPKVPSLVIEAENDAFFPPSKESAKLFKHKNIIHKVFPWDHAAPIFYPEAVHEEAIAFYLS